MITPLVVAFSVYELLLVVHVLVAVFPLRAVVLAPTARLLSEQFHHASTLPLSTLLVELVGVSEMVVREAVVVPETGSPTPVSEITPTTNGQK